MAAYTVNFSISARKVRIVPYTLGQNASGSSLGAGQAVFGTTGSGAVVTTPAILDRGFHPAGGVSANKIDGTVVAWSGTYLSVMAKVAAGAGSIPQLTFLFSDFQETIAGATIPDTATLFTIMLPFDDLPGVLVTPGLAAWVAVRNIEIGAARFVIPNLTNIGASVTGAWRMMYWIHDRMG